MRLRLARRPRCACPRRLSRPRCRLLWGWALAVALVVACTAAPTATPSLRPGTPTSPRPVNVILKDYYFVPNQIELVRGETVEFRLINGGVIAHDFVLGGPETQAAWESAEANPSPGAPGQTPDVHVEPAMGGLRVVLASGETRTGIIYTVPLQGPLWVGCHIPGHTAEGMVGEVRFVDLPAP